MTVSLDLGHRLACNTIFSWPFLQIIESSIMNDNNVLVIGLLGEKFRLEMMVPKISKEAPKTSEGLPVSLSVAIQEKHNHMKDKVINNIRVELKKTVIHKLQIPGQH